MGRGSAESKKGGQDAVWREVLNGTQGAAGRECDLKYCVHDWLSFPIHNLLTSACQFLNVCGARANCQALP